MKSSFLLVCSLAVLGLLFLTHGSEVVGGPRIGILVGAGLVVFVLYPVFLRDSERRIAALERAGRSAPPEP
jgi:hypothetical protein